MNTVEPSAFTLMLTKRKGRNARFAAFTDAQQESTAEELVW
jgi:hypothetical protein